MSRPHAGANGDGDVVFGDSNGAPSAIGDDDILTSQQEENEVLQLARNFTIRSIQGSHESPFNATPDGPLDPKSPNFKAREWARAFYNVRYMSDDGVPPRVAGLAFKNLNVWGMGSTTDYQPSVGNAMFKLPFLLGYGENRIDILQDMDGLLLPGEMLCVLGPPGSGCSTLLKTIAGDTHGLRVNPDSLLNYQGITPQKMKTVFKGEAIYTAEVDAHYPQLSVGDTLYFAALARAPSTIPGGVDRGVYATHLRDVIMAMFGISHTVDTRVGNDFVRGVSGGERKRVTIAEASLSYAPLQCWDNSTRGLDSANAVEFCKTLRTQSDVFGSTACVAIYQSPQAAYELFDKVTVLYEGRQIYFGKASEARTYFTSLGFDCPESQTTPDFLTSMTSPTERITRPGFESTAPRTPDEFVKRWRDSPEYRHLIQEITTYHDEHPFDGQHFEKFSGSRKAEKSNRQRENSPYTLSYISQVKLCNWRELQKLKNDPSIPIAMLVTNIFEALIIASIFVNLPQTTTSLYPRGVVLFMMILLNAFSSLIEIISLYAKRAIVEKHNRYALYHPSAEALSSLIMDLPYKITNGLITNIILYFTTGLRREAGPFFFFFLISFTMTLAISSFFRFFASVTKTVDQAMAPSSIIIIALVLYTGFTIPVQYMKGWASWIRWVNPISYGFESVMVNEFHGQDYSCSGYIPSGPGYDGVDPEHRTCASKGSLPGLEIVSGTAYIQTTFGFHEHHKWRNFGILVLFAVALMACHLLTSEIVSSERSRGEVKVFKRGKSHKSKAKREHQDEETGKPALPSYQGHDDDAAVKQPVGKQSSIFHWEDVCYEVQVKGESRVILDHVDGWIKPGTLTALMGVSGAGKTTLLDVLASRTTVGIISGNMFVDGRNRDESFQRKTGYVQQQDLHLHSSTVREALEFSALLRQPPHYSYEEKMSYVDYIIDLLGMSNYADAVVGVPGSGLNVEERKRLTIGVELAARPKLLLFLDEPTSGLDSQTSWSICNLMEKLTRSGQAILCTIHQPSAMLFQRFDRLLLLAKGGKTVYFGEVGDNASVLLDYFVRNGGSLCPANANPAEYMLEVIGAAPGTRSEIDWPSVWKKSPEYREIRAELTRLRDLVEHPSAVADEIASSHREFAASFTAQLLQVLKRLFQQYWRTPSYIYSKVLLAVGCSMLIGFSFFMGENTMQGLNNQMFGVFAFIFVIITVVMQIIPVFVTQRTLYEARERQSRTYSWQAFIISNLIVEFAWNSAIGILCFFVWYYPMGLYRNAEYTSAVHSRGILVVLLIWVIFMFASSFAIMMISGIENPEVASANANALSIMMYAFCGILAGPDTLPRFWIFMYRVNPLTYFTSSFMATTLANAPVYCAENEYREFQAPEGLNCGTYLEPYVSAAGGYILNPLASGLENCQYCQMHSTNTFLISINSNFSERWRDFGIVWVYVLFNTATAILFYWLFRVPKGGKKASTM
ncbi:hypothetical protein TWF481_007186 [Arthrobotrys musiformis]|uniref:ABC transporter domain-containing protein n=1 Tax=Arthrobotrys musiformis TaxID=47236 RepID=A0AAV9WGG2_9PEZI